ncbi:MAG: hypothetical protein Q7T87_02450 [Polaromonas sp.]|nr:hypothetical protein [Polaromonas sp.]
MKRCAPRLLSTALPPAFCRLALSASLLGMLAATGTAAHAQTTLEAAPPVRNLPKNAKRADLVVLDMTRITLDGKPARLSPGSRIRGPENQLLLTNVVLNQKLDVKYLRESGGLINQVWVLNSTEAKEDRHDSLFDKVKALFTENAEDTVETYPQIPYNQLPQYGNLPAQGPTQTYSQQPDYGSRATYGQMPAYGNQPSYSQMPQTTQQPAYNQLPAYDQLPAYK